MDFWKDKFPEYYTLGVRTVTSDELNDSTKWFFKGRYKRDLIYTGIRAGGGGSHHMLCTVDFTEKKVKMYDSNKRNHEQDHTGKGEKILAFVEAKAKRDRIPFDVKKWTIEDKTNCPQQTNCHDCGVYVCTLA